MMRYTIYETRYAQNKKKFFAKHKGVQISYKSYYAKMAFDIYHCDSTEKQELYHGVLAEAKYEQRNRPTIFVEEALLEMMRQSNIYCDETQFKVPLGGCVVFAMPSHIYIDKKKENSILIQCGKIEEDVDICIKANGFEHLMKYYVRVLTNHNILCSNEKHEFIGAFNNKTDTSEAVELAISLCVYISSFPECLKPGVPEGIKISGEYESNQYSRMLSLPQKITKIIKEQGRKGHVRMGHFRCLRNTRYKRDSEGNMRMVYVKPCVVSGNITPYTARGERRG